MTFKGQGHDLNIFKARYFENGSRYRLGFNRAPSPSQLYIKAVKKFTWWIYALSEHLLVTIVFDMLPKIEHVQFLSTCYGQGFQRCVNLLLSACCLNKLLMRTGP